MGCGGSKLDSAGLPPGIRHIQRKIEETKRLCHEGYTTELLHPIDADDDDVAAAPAPAPAPAPAAITESLNEKAKKVEAVKSVATIAPVEEKMEAPAAAEEEKDGERGEENEEEKARRLGWKGEADELPGSPSFRFYFDHNSCGSAHESCDSSVIFEGQSMKNKEELDDLEKKASAEGGEDKNKSSNSNEEEELKQQKEKKGKKMRALTKAPSAVCQLLKVRSCYSIAAAAAQTKESPRLVDAA